MRKLSDEQYAELVREAKATRPLNYRETMRLAEKYGISFATVKNALQPRRTDDSSVYGWGDSQLTGKYRAPPFKPPKAVPGVTLVMLMSGRAPRRKFG